MCHIEEVDGKIVVIGPGDLIMQGCTIGPIRGDGGREVHFSQSNTRKIVYESGKAPKAGPPIRSSRSTRGEWSLHRARSGSTFYAARSA